MKYNVVCGVAMVILIFTLISLIAVGSFIGWKLGYEEGVEQTQNTAVGHLLGEIEIDEKNERVFKWHPYGED